MNNQGWIKIHRKSIESSVWKNPIVWIVWSWCLLKANHQPTQFPFNGKDISVGKGSFITGREIGASECHITERKWRTAINYLKTTSRITTKSTNKFSVITILKWNDYQDVVQLNDQPLTNKRPTNDQQMSTYNNDKNVKNDKNNIQVVDKITKWAYERAKVNPSCNKDAFIISVNRQIQRVGVDKVYKLFEKSENAIQFLIDIKSL